VASLDDLRDRLAQRPLTFIERSATERSLQIVIEAAVGASKHTLRAHGRPIPTEARTAIERVYEVTGLTTPALDEMRGAVGMRNAIVHDYLNLDWALLERVLTEGRYRRVQQFVRILVEGLLGGR
jgi:uncharacterized protein YutE (UPF0331/DUF86 family)